MSPAAPPSPFPDIRLPDLEGVPRLLGEAWANGDALVAIGHSECRTTLLSLPFVDRLHRRLGSRVVLVLQDDSEAARDVVAELGLEVPVRLEPHPYPLARALGIACVPTFFLVDAAGRIAGVGEGFSRVDLVTLAERLGLAHPFFVPGDDAPAFRPG